MTEHRKKRFAALDKAFFRFLRKAENAQSEQKKKWEEEFLRQGLALLENPPELSEKTEKVKSSQ